ncbi:MAG TPA: hypothetical protein VNN80_12360 [Polyangiaceae bacterium]|jgi:hypothetical protein|nr:hypothetical protein [Polyangiaceae bacterium]
MGARERWEVLTGVSVGLGLTLAVLSPLTAMDEDSFPISSYPMFARPRGQPTLYAVVGRAADGSEVRLPASVVASSEPLQTKVLIQRSVEQGPDAMLALCRSVAERVAEGPERLRSVEIVRRRYDPIEYFTRGPVPLEQERLSSCRVPRRRGAHAKGPR